jgi:hypothetical protein
MNEQCYCGFFRSEHNEELRQFMRSHDDLVPCYGFRLWPAEGDDK